MTSQAQATSLAVSGRGAVYRAVSKQVWSAYQKRVLQAWKNERHLKARQVHTRRYYIPLITPWAEKLGDDAKVLEIGSGPVCAAQYVSQGHASYVDPLLDDYRRMFPGVMPEDASYMAVMAEQAILPESAYDLVLCLDTLSDVHNPELVLHQMRKALKPEGYCIISMDVWAVLLARLHYVLSRFFPALPTWNRLYSYTYRGFRHTLLRHFTIVDEAVVRPVFPLSLFKKEILFVCKHK